MGGAGSEARRSDKAGVNRTIVVSRLRVYTHLDCQVSSVTKKNTLRAVKYSTCIFVDICLRARPQWKPPTHTGTGRMTAVRSRTSRHTRACVLQRGVRAQHEHSASWSSSVTIIMTVAPQSPPGRGPPCPARAPSLPLRTWWAGTARTRPAGAACWRPLRPRPAALGPPHPHPTPPQWPPAQPRSPASHRVG